MGFARHHLALAAALLVAGSGAQALGLGKLSVQSALGETMRAEIDITSLTPEEAASLKVRVAPPEAYRTSGVEYNPVLTSAQVQVVRNGGRTVLRVSSDRSVQEPFVDVILELTWASGRLVREYTLLFDPPGLTKPAPAVTAAPAMAAAPAASAEAVPAPAPATSTALPRTPPAAAPVAAARPAASAPAPAVRPAVAAGGEYEVRPGDSLSKVAARTQVSGISLDQMLVGLFRNNPDAFIDGNMNRLKAGSVLQVPGSEALSSVSPGEARQIILAQSADFSAYRQRLASAAPTLQSTESERQSKGQVQAAVEDRKPAAAPTPDKLTLSKAGSTAASAAEAKISKDTEKKDAAARVAELTRNVEELKKLSSAAKPATPAAASAPATTPAPALPAPVVAATEPASAAAPASAAVAVAASAAASKPMARASAPAAPPPAAEPPSFIDMVLDSPFVVPAAALVVAVLGGFGLYRLRSRRPANAAETGFHESRLQPDSFFGGTGGQRVDTRDAQNSGQSSMSYSLSQLDAIGDVDPVAEADVYLAYGRDLQAEEILKEALRAHPDRLAIQLKLLEIYAKRRDVRAFESIATGVHRQTSGEGPEWNRVCELGLGIDPGNALYQPGGLPASDAAPQFASAEPPADVPVAEPEPVTEAAPTTSSVDLDLDLDFSLDDEPRPAAAPASEPVATAPTAVDLDFDLPAESARVDDNSLDFEAPALASDTAPVESVAAPAESKPADSGALEFDLGSLSLDLDGPSTEQTPVSDDPLATKLALAEEFSAIGDTDGARALIEEIIAEATGDMKTKAQEALSRLG